MKKIIQIFILILCCSGAVLAQDLCSLAELQDSPTLAEGRIKPLSVHVREFFQRMNLVGCARPVQEFCLLSLGRDQDLSRENCFVEFKVEHKKIKELFSGKSRVSPDEIQKQSLELKSQYQREVSLHGKDSPYARELDRLLLGLDLLADLKSGLAWNVLDLRHKEQKGNSTNNSMPWIPISDLMNDKLDLVSAVTEQSRALSEKESTLLRYELLFEKLRPFDWAILLMVLNFALVLALNDFPGLKTQARLLSALVWALIVVGVTLRVLISQRGPVTNMYETVMWVTVGVLSLGLLMSFIRKEAFPWLMAMGSSLVGLLMMRFATSMLDSGIRPLVPVLRDNFWLSTHVTTITLSYACFFFTWIIANVALLRNVFFKKDQDLSATNGLIRMCLQIGSVLLAAGIILGGIWADYSWGRFWGWDPKETWSLIALVIYMAILHGKYAGWFRDLNFLRATAVGFLFVLMAWFGVNYILATGLHSYGFSQGGALFLALVLVFQLVVLAISRLRAL